MNRRNIKIYTKLIKEPFDSLIHAHYTLSNGRKTWDRISDKQAIKISKKFHLDIESNKG